MHAIRAGEGHVFISAGVEMVSRYPRVEPAFNPRFADAQERTARCAPWTDPRAAGEVPDIYISMGLTAENLAEDKNISREEMDHFGVRSQNLAEKAIADGFWANEITPVTLPDGRVVSADDGPRSGVTYDTVAQLKPVFRPDGRVTAGNCCALNDGAAALVIMSDAKAAQLDITPLARIVSTAVSGLSPEIMGLGPVAASRRALALAGMSVSDIDLVEINEAFAAQGHPLVSGPGDPTGEGERQRRRHRRRPPFRNDRRPHHHDPAQLAALARQAVRPGNNVRRRRPRNGHGYRAPQLTRSSDAVRTS